MAEIRFDVPEIELLRIGSITFAPGTVPAPFRVEHQVEVAWMVAAS